MNGAVHVAVDQARASRSLGRARAGTGSYFLSDGRQWDAQDPALIDREARPRHVESLHVRREVFARQLTESTTTRRAPSTGTAGLTGPWIRPTRN